MSLRMSETQSQSRAPSTLTGYEGIRLPAAVLLDNILRDNRREQPHSTDHNRQIVQLSEADNHIGNEVQRRENIQ